MSDMISYEEWVETYKPIGAMGDAFNEPYLFETYGRDIDLVLNTENSKVWTLVVTDEGDDFVTEVVLAGYHLVNRMGYFITMNPWLDKGVVVDWSED